jgi:hypothetical protein
MRNLAGVVCLLGILVATVHGASPNPQSAPQNDSASVVITFKDGQQQSFLMTDIARIEYRDAGDSMLGWDYFLGKWQVGNGTGGTFFITFENQWRGQQVHRSKPRYLDRRRL